MKRKLLVLAAILVVLCMLFGVACTQIPSGDPSSTTTTTKPPVEEPPVDNPPVDNPPVDNPPVDNPPQLSSDASFTVVSINQNAVVGGSVMLSEAQLAQLMQAEDISEFIVAQNAAGSQLSFELDKEQKAINFTCTAEDGVTKSSTRIELKIKSMFGSHSVQGNGSANNGKWDESRGAYYITGVVAALDENGANLVNNYAYKFSVTPDALSAGSEVVISSYETESLMIRFVLRGVDENHFLLFTDYRDNSGYLNYLELKTNVEYTPGQKLSFEVINLGNSMVMIFEGETLFRRELSSIDHSELVLNAITHSFKVNDIEVETDEAKVKAAHDAALEGYDESLVGPNSIGYDFLLENVVQNEDGSLYIPGATSNNRVMGGYFHHGVPVSGHEFAVSVTIRMENTKESGGTASKTEFQLYKDAKNSVKFHMFRYPTNNTLMAYETRNDVQTEIAIRKGEFPTGTDYTYSIIALYKLGRVELWIKDNYETNSSSIYEDYTLVYAGYYDWNNCGFAFAMRQYADTTWSDWNVYYNDDFDALYDGLHPEIEDTDISFSNSKTDYYVSSVFTPGEHNDYYKESTLYSKAFIANDNTVVCGGKWIVNLTASFESYTKWGQAEFQFHKDDTNAIRYVFEYDGGNFQVFTERKSGTADWQNWALVRRPSDSTPAYMNMTAVYDNGHVYFLLGGKVWHEYEATGYTDLYATFGGKGSTIKLTELSVVTDEQAVDQFIANMEYYVYESSYEGRIQNLHNEYKDAQKGGIVLAGSSSVDFWNTWQEDLGEDVLAYNMGIGGTTTYDWQVAYERLIKYMEPSQILLFLGGNDVNGLRETGEATAKRLQDMLELMHSDFPNANIVYVLSMPVPNNYSNGNFTTEYGNLVEAMKAYGAANTSWLKTVDLEEYLTVDGKPVAEYFKSDNIHLTEEGYKIWTSHIKPLLVHEDTVKIDKSYNVLAGSWSVTEDENGIKTYTSTSDKSYLVFNEVTLKDKVVVEFDFKVLESSSYTAGMMFGLTSTDSMNGLCVGRNNAGNPASAWIENGAQGSYGDGDTAQLTMTELNKTYRIKIVCDIKAGTYDMYIDGVFARHLYFVANTTDNKTANDTLHTGLYFGLFGGATGRTQFSNIVISDYVEPEPDPEPDPEPKPEDTPYNILEGTWDITTDENGIVTYTSTSDKAYLVFKEALTSGKFTVEFDFKILEESSYSTGIVFGLNSDTALNGVCVGRAKGGNPGSGWIENGIQGTTGGGGTTHIKLAEIDTLYEVKIVCDIEAGTYDVYINGEFARNLYFKVDTTNNKTADDVLHTGLYFGLYGGLNGRTQFSDIVITYDEPTVDEGDGEDNEGAEESVKYEIIGGSWDITKDENGKNVYTSTSNGALLGFSELTLVNNAVVEFDMKLLASGSSVVGLVFGMDSPTDNSGFCIGRTGSNAGCTWFTNGAPNGYGKGTASPEYTVFAEDKTYHIRVECDIANGVYEIYVDGVYVRQLYFETSSTSGKESLHTGAYFGLYGGKSGGRTQFSNITIVTDDAAAE